MKTWKEQVQIYLSVGFSVDFCHLQQPTDMFFGQAFRLMQKRRDCVMAQAPSLQVLTLAQSGSKLMHCHKS